MLISVSRILFYFLAAYCPPMGADGNDFAGWEYRMKIAFPGYAPSGGGEVLTNFPVQVIFNTNISGFSYSQFQSEVGGDLRFQNSNETVPLNHEIEEWNTNGNSCVWIQLPLLSSSNDYIWAYWGNRKTNSPACSTNGATWSQGYAGVWHLRDGTGKDSTVYTNNGSVYGTANAAGVIGYGRTFNGLSDSISLPGSSSLAIGTGGTLSCWMKLGAWNVSTEGSIISDNIDFSAINSLYLSVHNSVGLHFRYGMDGSGPYLNYQNSDNWADNSWHYLTAVWNNYGGTTYLYLYADGIQVDSDTWNQCINITPEWKLGVRAGAYYLNGVMDDACISSVARSSNWIWACWLNQGSNNFFNLYSKVEKTCHGTVMYIH